MLGVIIITVSAALIIIVATIATIYSRKKALKEMSDIIDADITKELGLSMGDSHVISMDVSNTADTTADTVPGGVAFDMGAEKNSGVVSVVEKIGGDTVVVEKPAKRGRKKAADKESEPKAKPVRTTKVTKVTKVTTVVTKKETKAPAKPKKERAKKVEEPAETKKTTRKKSK